MAESKRVTCFIDTNVWLYAFIESQDESKSQIAQELIATSRPMVSTQIVNEICVNLIRQTNMLEHEIRELIASFYKRYSVISLDSRILLQASRLRESYSLSFWDSLIVSSALESEVSLLYSEDMQDRLKIRNRLEIRNPFREQEKS